MVITIVNNFTRKQECITNNHNKNRLIIETCLCCLCTQGGKNSEAKMVTTGCPKNFNTYLIKMYGNAVFFFKLQMNNFYMASE